MTYFLGDCIGEAEVEIVIWGRNIAQKLCIIFKACVLTDRGKQVSQIWTIVDKGGEGVENYWKCADILSGWLPCKKVLLSQVYFRRTVERTYARIKCHELVNFLNIVNNIFKCCENKILSHRKSRTGKFNGLNLKESFEWNPRFFPL